MNCFYHPEKPAIALCKSCGRGLCLDCAADIGDGLACMSRCEERARIINRMIDTNKQILSAANTQLRRGMVFTIVTGLLFGAFGFYLGFDRGGLPGIIFIALGLAFLIRGVLSYTRGARYPTPDQQA